MHPSQFQQDLGRLGRAQLYRWAPPSGDSHAILHIVHGMAEHAERYGRLAEALTVAGITVYAQDLPGHGRSAPTPQDLGHFADRDGWRHVQDSIHAVQQHIRETEGDRPLFMLGHSMGSFLLQDYVVEHGSELAGAIFSATSGDLGPLRAIGLNLLRLEALWYGMRHRSALAEALTFRDFNRRFRPNRTKFDWLSCDAAEVDRYVNDPRCGFRCSVALWTALLEFCGRLRDPERLKRVPRALPILLINGSEDPATDGERGPRALIAAYGAAHLEDVSLRIYPGARHELFNETCRDEVTQDLLDWLNERLADMSNRRAA